MPRFAANLSFMYGELPFLERFGAAAADGFRAVEYLFPYEHAPQQIAARLQAHGLTQVLFNLAPGDWAAGERGLAALPGREAEFAASVEQALVYAQVLGCRRLHVMAGIVPTAADPVQLRATYVANLRRAAARLAPFGISLLIEPINTRDMPGYYLNYQQQAHDVVAEVGAPNLRVQMDIYHCQIMEGDVTTRLRRHLAGIGHMQIASVPLRNEPGSGELDDAYLFRLLDEIGYEGYVGCEYRPYHGSSAGLAWFEPWRAVQ